MERERGREKVKKSIRRKKILAASIIAASLFGGQQIFAGAALNENEQAVISALSGEYTYEGYVYKVDATYLAALQAYLEQDGIDLSDSQRDSCISQVNGSIGRGVKEGYLVKIRKAEEKTEESDQDKTEKPSSEQTEKGTNSDKAEDGKNEKDTVHGKEEEPAQEEEASKDVEQVADDFDIWQVMKDFVYGKNQSEDTEEVKKETVFDRRIGDKKNNATEAADASSDEEKDEGEEVSGQIGQEKTEKAEAYSEKKEEEENKSTVSNLLKYGLVAILFIVAALVVAIMIKKRK